jgi:hypothetical protein
MDVREDEVSNVRERQASLADPALEGLDARRGTAVDEGRLLAGKQVGRDDPRAAEMKEIEELRQRDARRR